MKDCVIFHFLYFIDNQIVTSKVLYVLKDRFFLLFHAPIIYLRYYQDPNDTLIFPAYGLKFILSE